MELWFAPTSPFARKVRVSINELGLDAEVKLVEVNPWLEGRLRELNPLSKVPTLVLANGEILFESAVICEYLDTLAGPRLFPPPDAGRWRALLLQGLADGASTAAGRLFADERRPNLQRSTDMMRRFETAIESALEMLERQQLSIDHPTIGEVSVAVLLGYLDFRWPERDWRSGRPNASQWFRSFEQRRSMQITKHKLPTA